MRRSFPAGLISIIWFTSICMAGSEGSPFLEKEAPPFQQGTWDLGGTVSFQSYSGETYTGTKLDSLSITFSPDVGYFVKDNLSAGGLLCFDRISSGDYSSQNLFFGPRVNYYLPREKSFRHFYGHFGLLYRIWAVDSSAEENSFSDNWIKIELGPGLHSFWNPEITWNMLLYFSYDHYSPEQGESLSGMEFGLRLGVSTFWFKRGKP